MGKFAKRKKKQNYQFKLKFVRQIRVYIQNSMVVVTFFYFQQETIFFGKFGPQNQNTSLS